MLSMISSPHINRSGTTMSEDMNYRYQVNAQAQLAQPFLHQNEQVNILTLNSLGAQDYKSAFPITLQQGQENSVQLKIFSTAESALICKSKATGCVEGFCRPLAEKLSGSDSICKLYVKANYPGSGQMVVILQDNLKEVANVVIDFEVVAGGHYSPAEQNQIALVNTAPLQSSYCANHTAQLIPPINATQQITDNMYRQGNPVPMMTSATPATYLNNGTMINPDIMDITNKYLYSSNLNDVTTAPQITHNTQPALYDPALLYKNESEIPPQVDVQTQNFDQTQFLQANMSAHFNNQSIPPMQSSKISKQKYGHLTNTKIKQYLPQSQSMKLIRVLPSDVLFQPASYDAPTLRTVRIRNVVDQELNVQCQIARRLIPNLTPNILEKIDFCENESAFKLTSANQFTLQPCYDQNSDIQSFDLDVEFKPKNSGKQLFCAKLIIKIEAVDGALQKMFQVPLLGVYGVPVIVPEFRFNGQQRILSIKNEGNGEAFVKISNKVIKQNAQSTGYEEAGRYQMQAESVLLKVGQVQQIMMYDTQNSVKADDEEEILELRCGSEQLRLLALGKEGHGEYASLVEKLQLKDDVLRVMGNNIEVVRLVVE